MKIIFLTLAKINSIEVQGIYTDLLRKFRDNGHDLIIVSPTERKFKNKTNYFTEGKVKILNVWTTNIQKTNIIEKGFGTLILEFIFKKAINKFFKNEKFDLIIQFQTLIFANRIGSFSLNVFESINKSII